MGKTQLKILIAQYKAMLKDIENTLMEMRGLEDTEVYSDMYNLGNDISQQLAEFENKLKYA